MTGKAFVYSKVIKISRDDMSMLRAGKKRCTVRLGTASVAQPEIDLSDGRSSVRVHVTNVDNSRTFDELTDGDAQAEGFKNREELLNDLRKYYPRVKPTDKVTVISFHPKSVPSTLFPPPSE